MQCNRFTSFSNHVDVRYTLALLYKESKVIFTLSEPTVEALESP